MVVGANPSKFTWSDDENNTYLFTYINYEWKYYKNNVELHSGQRKRGFSGYIGIGDVLKILSDLGITIKVVCN